MRAENEYAKHIKMSIEKITNSYEFQPTDGKPQKLVILLHGLGSNGQDLISLAPYWARDLKDTVFVSPDAPFPCDMAPPGYPNSFQWFSLQNRDPDIILSGIKTAAPILEAFIQEQLAKYDIPAEKCALTGFSQGTMMSLYQAPRFPLAMAGVLGYSGALFWEEGADNASLNRIPIHLIHGGADDVVPVESWYIAKTKLEEENFPFSGHTTAGLAHNIDEEGIMSGGTFLASILS